MPGDEACCPDCSAPMSPDSPSCGRCGRSVIEAPTAAEPGPTLADESGAQADPLANTQPWAAPAPAELPEVFGRYRIERVLGRGGMGAVYLAHDTQLDRRVALKVPHFSPQDGPEVLDRFYREARAAATFDHPNLCPVYDVGQVDGVHYLTMPYLHGKALSEVIRPSEPIPARQVAAVVRKLALALEEAHRRGVIHRDLKPANIMVNRRRELVVMDFGLARRGETEEKPLTKVGAVLGTPHYMAPEQVRGEPTGPASDIYALGVILYEMLAGRRPYEGPVTLVLGLIAVSAPEPPSAYRAGLDPDLEAICLKAMAKQVGDRYASMAEFASALGKFLSRSARPSMPSRPVGSSAAPRPSDSVLVPVASESLVNQFFANLVTEEETLSILVQPRHAAGAGRGGRRRYLAVGVGGAAAVLALGAVFLMARDARQDRPSTDDRGAGDGVPALGRDALRRPLVEARKAEPAPEATPTPEAAPAEPGPALAGEPTTPIPSPERPPTPTASAAGETAPTSADLSKPIRRFRGHTSQVNSVAFSPDGKWALSGGNDRILIIWDVESGEEIKRIEGIGEPIWGVAFLPDGHQVLFGGGANQEQGQKIDATPILHQWDLATGRMVREFKGHTLRINSLSVSADGRLALTSAMDKTLRLWDVASGKALGVVAELGGMAGTAAISPDGRLAVSGGSNGVVRLWDLATRRQIRAFEPSHEVVIREVAISPGGRLTLSGGMDNTARLWDIKTGQLLATLPHPTGVVSVAFTPDGRSALTGSGSRVRDRGTGSQPTDFDFVLRLWDLRTRKEIRRYEGHESTVKAIAVSPDGRFALTGSTDKTLILWRLPEPEPAGSVEDAGRSKSASKGKAPRGKAAGRP